MARKKIIVANWKMNPGTLKEGRVLFQHVRRAGSHVRNVQTVVCPPFVFLGDLVGRVSGRRVVLGAQDVFQENPPAGKGAYTGEVSVRQLVSLGVKYVILGHSERRAQGETDKDVSKKARVALAEGVAPIICVGEATRDAEGEYLHMLREEIQASLAGVARKDIGEVVIAYEPIWAVGAKARRADTPEGALETAIFIRKTLCDMFGKKHGLTVPMLYGGSVTEKNAEGFLWRAGMDGLLVGRASLDAKQFAEILRIAGK